MEFGAVGADHRCGREVTVSKPLVLVAVLAAIAAVTAKRRQAQSEAVALWREATSDASR